MIKGINHIAIVVRNLDEALSFYERVFGWKAAHIETIPEQAVKSALIPFGEGGTTIELIEPIDSQSGVAKFLEKRGEGVHHISLEVDDINQELRALEAKGVELIDKQARRGVAGMIAFLHPKSTRGILLELTQRVKKGEVK